ncbi:hypothetical protein ACJBU6_04907 [Exserohilum turcicum]
MKVTIYVVLFIAKQVLAGGRTYDFCKCMKYPETSTPDWCATAVVCVDIGSKYRAINNGGWVITSKVLHLASI